MTGVMTVIIDWVIERELNVGGGEGRGGGVIRSGPRSIAQIT